MRYRLLHPTIFAAANLLTNPQLDPMGKIPEFKFCAAKMKPCAVELRRLRQVERKAAS
jgi:hypothetical protein